MTDILIDGYNVIKNNAMFQFLEVKSRAEARALLIKQLRNRYLHSPDTIIVVFDGAGAKEQMSHEDHICIIFSRHGETADAVIKRLAAQAHKAGHKVAMYSNDEEVRRAVTEVGGQVLTTGQLTKHLTAAPHDVALRSAHRQWARRTYGIDPMYKGDDEPEPPRSHGKKKKKRRK